jgi:hypothetical protein
MAAATTTTPTTRAPAPAPTADLRRQHPNARVERWPRPAPPRRADALSPGHSRLTLSQAPQRRVARGRCSRPVDGSSVIASQGPESGPTSLRGDDLGLFPRRGRRPTLGRRIQHARTRWHSMTLELGQSGPAPRSPDSRLGLLAALGAAGVVTGGVAAARFTRWGATPEEVSRALPGDNDVVQPTLAAVLGQVPRRGGGSVA